MVGRAFKPFLVSIRTEKARWIRQLRPSHEYGPGLFLRVISNVSVAVPRNEGVAVSGSHDHDLARFRDFIHDDGGR